MRNEFEYPLPRWLRVTWAVWFVVCLVLGGIAASGCDVADDCEADAGADQVDADELPVDAASPDAAPADANCDQDADVVPIGCVCDPETGAGCS